MPEDILTYAVLQQVMKYMESQNVYGRAFTQVSLCSHLQASSRLFIPTLVTVVVIRGFFVAFVVISHGVPRSSRVATNDVAHAADRI